MSKMTTPKETTAWMQVEELGMKVSTMTGAMSIGCILAEESEKYAGGLQEELKDFFALLCEYGRSIEAEADRIAAGLLEETKGNLMREVV